MNNAYTPQQIFVRWKNEDLTIEQTIGQIVLNLIALEQENASLRREIAVLKSKSPAAIRSNGTVYRVAQVLP